MSAGSAQDSTPFILRVFEAAEQVLWSSSVSLAFSDNKAVSSSFQAERVWCLGKASRVGSAILSIIGEQGVLGVLRFLIRGGQYSCPLHSVLLQAHSVMDHSDLPPI